MAKKSTNIKHTELPKLKTGIHGFDMISLGGLPKNRVTLIAGTSGSAKTIFGLQFLYNGATQFKEPGVFVTFEETSSDIQCNVKSFGWDLVALQKKRQFIILDASPLPGETLIEGGVYDFSGLVARIHAAVQRIQAKRVCLDSIGALFSQFTDSGTVRTELFRLSAALKEMDVTAVITCERIDDYGAITRFGVEEFVADNVMILRNTLADEKRRRTLEILKYRGAKHQKGEFPFTVTGNGIEALPLVGIELNQRSSNKRLSSGTKMLDTMCGSGFYRDSIILVSGATGTGKTLTVSTYINEGCKNKEKTMLFAFEESREQLHRNASGWGMNFKAKEKAGLLRVVCAYPETAPLEDHLLHIQSEIEEFKPNRIAIDSLSALERVSTTKSFREFVIGITSFVKKKEIAGLFTSTTEALMGGTSVTETHISTITDTIILLRYVELFGAMRRGITVLKMRGSMHDKAIREYFIDKHGMHIKEPFSNFSGIIAGKPEVVLSESDQLKNILGEHGEL